MVCCCLCCSRLCEQFCGFFKVEWDLFTGNAEVVDEWDLWGVEKIYVRGLRDWGGIVFRIARLRRCFCVDRTTRGIVSAGASAEGKIC